MKLHRAIEMRSVLTVYGLMTILALVFGWIQFGSALGVWTPGRTLGAADIGFGIAIFVSFLIVYFAATSLSESGSELKRAFQQMLTPISYFQIVLLAIFSGAVEEWFFRGLLTPQFGVILSSFVFGLAHLLPSRGTIQWGLLMTFLGLALGLLFSRTQSLVLVSTVHTTINLILLLHLNQTAHQRSSANALGKY